MIGGHFRGAQFYTRTTKLVTGVELRWPHFRQAPTGRCALGHSLVPLSGGLEGWILQDPTSIRRIGNGPMEARERMGTPTAARPSVAWRSPGAVWLQLPAQILTWLPDPDGTINGLAQLKLAGVKGVGWAALYSGQ